MSGPDHHLIVVVHETASCVSFIDSQNYQTVATVDVGYLPHEIEFTEDYKTAFVSNFGLHDYDLNIGTGGTTLSVINIPSMCEAYRIFTFDQDGNVFHAPHGMKLTPDEKKLYVNVEKGDNILVFDLETPPKSGGASFSRFARVLEVPEAARFRSLMRMKAGSSEEQPTPREHFTAPQATHNILFSTDGTSLFLQAGSNGIYRMDPGTGEITGHLDIRSSVHGLTYTSDKTAIIASGVDTLVLFSPDTMEEVRRIENLGVGQLLYSVPTPDGKYVLCPGVWDSQVVVVELDSGAVVGRIVTGLDPVHIALSPSGRVAYVTNARAAFISAVDLDTYTVQQIPTAEGPNGIACIPYTPFLQRPELLLGMVLPLSGADYSSGRDYMAGTEFWRERVNSAGGILVDGIAHQVRTIYLDNQSNNDLTVELATQLVTVHNINFFGGSYPTTGNLSQSQVAEKYKIPMINASGAGEIIYNQGNEWVFGILSPAGGYLRGSVDLAIAQIPVPTTFVLLSCDDPAALEDGLETAKYAESKGLKIVSLQQPYPKGVERVEQGVIVYTHLETDFAEVMSAIKTLNPDFFMNTGHLPEAEAIVNAAAAVDLKPLGLAFSVGPSLPDFLSAVGDNANNLLGATQWASGLPFMGYDRWVTPAYFAKDFQTRYSMEGNYLSAGAAACGVVLHNAVRLANSKDPEAIRRKLAYTDTDTFYARIKLDDRGLNSNKPMITIQLHEVDGSIKTMIVGPPGYAGDNQPVWPFPGWGVSSTDTSGDGDNTASNPAEYSPAEDGIPGPTGFTNASLNGAYWFRKVGGQPTFDTLGTINFDGVGRFGGRFVINDAGKTTELNYTGTYQINDDGTGTFTWLRRFPDGHTEEEHSHIVALEAVGELITICYSSLDSAAPSDGQLSGRMIKRRFR